MIRQGAIIGAVAVAIDEGLKAVSGRRLHLPPLAIGMGIYLPMEADLLIPFGAVLGFIALAGLAVGWRAIGGGAVGYRAFGGLAVGGYAYAGNGVAYGYHEACGRQKEKLVG